MTDSLITHIVEAVVLGILLAFSRWKAQRDFETQRGQNQALRDLQEKAGVETSAPPAPSRPKRKTLGILPKAPTPLPFFPVRAAAEAVPEPVELERSMKQPDDE